MKNQALFSWKDKSKKLKCRLLQFLFGALRVKNILEPSSLYVDSMCSFIRNLFLIFMYNRCLNFLKTQTLYS